MPSGDLPTGRVVRLRRHGPNQARAGAEPICEDAITSSIVRTLAYRTRLSHEKSGTRQIVISRTAVYRTGLPTPARPVMTAPVPFAFAGISGWGWAGRLFGSG